MRKESKSKERRRVFETGERACDLRHVLLTPYPNLRHVCCCPLTRTYHVLLTPNPNLPNALPNFQASLKVDPSSNRNREREKEKQTDEYASESRPVMLSVTLHADSQHSSPGSELPARRGRGVRSLGGRRGRVDERAGGREGGAEGGRERREGKRERERAK
eukprot:920174-Rhodomonas_salina.1